MMADAKPRGRLDARDPPVEAGAAARGQPAPAKPSIVLVHGIWADASTFNNVIPVLQDDGYEVVAAQCDLETLASDVEAVKRALGRVRGPTILVGHSYGGTVITAAGVDARVAGLVYIAALAPNEDETSQSLRGRFPASDVLDHTEVLDGRRWLTPEAVAYLDSDLSDRKRRLIWSTQAAPAADLFLQKVEGTAWRTKPSWYVVAQDDRVANPELQRFIARRMGATLYETSGGHISMLKSPEIVIKAIRDAADAVAAAGLPSANPQLVARKAQT